MSLESVIFKVADHSKSLLRRALLIVMVMTIVADVEAQSDSTAKKKNFHGLSIIPLPAIAANPTAGWMFGVAPGASWFMGDPSDTHISTFLGTLIWTTHHQWIITAKANTFLNHDSWNLLTDFRYFITSQPTYGLGTGPQSAKPISNGFIKYSDNPYDPISTAQMMEFDFIRLHQTVMRRYQDSYFYAGLGYHLDYHYHIHDNLLDLDENDGDGQALTSHYLYSVSHGFDPERYTLSGVSFNLLYDSRDNAVNPYSGRYAFANIRVNPEFMGSDQNASLLWLEYRDYIHFSKARPRHLLGFWTYGWFQVSNDVPYMDLPAVGWDQFGRSGRAYTQGRFRGENLMYFETEYRFPLLPNKEFLGGVVFMNATTATNKAADIGLFDYMDPAVGVGLRVMINKKSRANLNIDYAWGKYGAQGFYFGLNEAF
jgi:hypothetical protein